MGSFIEWCWMETTGTQLCFLQLLAAIRSLPCNFVFSVTVLWRWKQDGRASGWEEDIIDIFVMRGSAPGQGQGDGGISAFGDAQTSAGQTCDTAWKLAPLCRAGGLQRSHPASVCLCWAGLQGGGIKPCSSHRGEDVVGSAVCLARELSLRQATAEEHFHGCAGGVRGFQVSQTRQ